MWRDLRQSSRLDRQPSPKQLIMEFTPRGEPSYSVVWRPYPSPWTRPQALASEQSRASSRIRLVCVLADARAGQKRSQRTGKTELPRLQLIWLPR